MTVKPKDEQGERIRENWQALQKDAQESGVMFSLEEFEEVFEDRDPFEFL